MPVDEIALEAEERMEKAIEVLHEEFKSIRTGRASASLIENVKVDYYGAPTQLKQLANISTPEARLLVISPFDPGSLKEIEKALLASDLGITPNSDGKLIRLSIPPLSEERRKQLVGRVKEMSEETKISIRNVRRDANKHLEQEQKSSAISEDSSYTGKDDILKLTHDYEKKAQDLLDKKTAEIMEV